MHQNVVDAHRNQINAYRVVHVPLKGQPQLGSHAVSATDQHRLFVALGDFKQCTKAANTRQHAFTHGFFGKRLEAFDQRVSGIDVYACVFVANGGGTGIGHSGGFAAACRWEKLIRRMLLTLPAR